MTAAILRKYKTYLYDDQGKPVMVQFDLRNKLMKKAYEKIMEELDNQSTFEMIEKVKNDPTNTWSDFFEVTKNALKNTKNTDNV